MTVPTTKCPCGPPIPQHYSLRFAINLKNLQKRETQIAGSGPACRNEHFEWHRLDLETL